MKLGPPYYVHVNHGHIFKCLDGVNKCENCNIKILFLQDVGWVYFNKYLPDSFLCEDIQKESLIREIIE